MKSIPLLALLALAGFCQANPGARAVEGVISCGSGSAVHEIRITDCLRVPCEAHPGNSYRVEVDWTPAASHAALHLQILLNHAGEGHTIIDGEVADSAVEAGTRYTFGYTIQITGAFVGPANLAFRVFAAASPQDEICFLVPFNVLE